MLVKIVYTDLFSKKDENEVKEKLIGSVGVILKVLEELVDKIPEHEMVKYYILFLNVTCSIQ